MAQCTPKSFDLTGKVALITGASYGIGMAIAKAMAANGATIVFNDIKQELVDKGIAAYEEAGIKAHGYVCDVTDEDAVNAMVAKITEEVGHINILVNNAGIIKRIPMTEMTAAQFRQVIDVDLNAPFIVAKAVIPDMIAQGGGKIINICSMMSELGRETVSAYAAAKGGLKMLTKNIASEYGAYNIQCNGIGPGYIATPQTAPLRERQPDGSGRVVLPSDVWRMTEFCMEGWRQPVTSFIDHTSPAYELQFNLYTRGGVATPVCVLSNVGGQKCLDYYSLPPRVEAHRVKTARYVAYPQADADKYEIADSLVQVVCYTCAALVYEILGQPEQAAAMLRSIVK